MTGSLLKFEKRYSVKIGGRRYPVVKIGNQLWMAENLDYKWAGLDIGGIWATGSSHAWYYNNDEATYGVTGYKCGLLYNGFAMKYLHDNSISLLPDGWRIPSLTDFENLSTYIGNDSEFTKKLKAVDDSVSIGFPLGWNGTDAYGLGILPAGAYWETFIDIGTKCQIWTSTSTDMVNNCYAIYFRVVSNSLEYCKDGFDAAMSIRLVKTLT